MIRNSLLCVGAVQLSKHLNIVWQTVLEGRPPATLTPFLETIRTIELCLLSFETGLILIDLTQASFFLLARAIVLVSFKNYMLAFDIPGSQTSPKTRE